jgi:hypothetical protein
MLFIVVSKLIRASILVVAILGGVGAGFGYLIGHLEAEVREKKNADK